MSDTPRTDAEIAGVDWFVTDSDQRAHSATDYDCLADFARTLERESAAQAERIRELEGQLAAAIQDGKQAFDLSVECRQRALAAEQRLEQVEKALRNLRNEAGGLFAFGHEIRQVIGNTNMECLKRRIDEAKALS